MDTENLDTEIKISLMNKFIDTFTIVPQDHKNLSLEYFKEFAESK